MGAVVGGEGWGAVGVGRCGREGVRLQGKEGKEEEGTKLAVRLFVFRDEVLHIQYNANIHEYMPTQRQ